MSGTAIAQTPDEPEEIHRARPRPGISLPTFGPWAGPDAVATVASAAERLSFHSVTVSERLLLPAGPDWRNEARLPEANAWEPIDTLIAVPSTSTTAGGTTAMRFKNTRTTAAATALIAAATPTAAGPAAAGDTAPARIAREVVKQNKTAWTTNNCGKNMHIQLVINNGPDMQC
ncbi:hypothetical protein [Streptomyces sp. NPDC048411]|uniref:hypothetical protein n=1 Tax=Streptomyces sp. NPDC048411 TaxID=3157206 RepID=UPI003452F545